MMHAILKNEITVDIRLLILVINFFKGFRDEFVYLLASIGTNLTCCRKNFSIDSLCFTDKVCSRHKPTRSVTKVIVKSKRNFTMVTCPFYSIADTHEPNIPSLTARVLGCLDYLSNGVLKDETLTEGKSSIVLTCINLLCHDYIGIGSTRSDSTTSPLRSSVAILLHFNRSFPAP